MKTTGTATGGGFFEPTIWSTVLKVKAGDEATRMAALERLLTRYRRPILLEIQARRHCPPDQAEDLAHDFIHDCLRRGFLQDVHPDHGRFRAFIKACIGNFLCDVRDRETAAKRGGGQVPASLDETDEEGRPRHQPVDRASPPGQALDQAWAHQVLERARAQLEQECVVGRRGALYAALKPALANEGAAGPLAAIGERLGLSEGAVKVAAHRLRQRLGEIIAAEVKQTVGCQEEWQAELRYLVDLLGA
jgi:RNA polymerase sigma-70 factor (ECF subfamily)